MRTGYMAIGLAALVGLVPASLAHDSRVPDRGKPAGTGVEAGERQAQRPGSNTGISLAVPTGSVSVGPEFVDGEPIYVRRMTVREGMTIVEVSATPFMADLHSSEAPPIARPDQPASW
jgi:hypothetical protein